MYFQAMWYLSCILSIMRRCWLHACVLTQSKDGTVHLQSLPFSPLHASSKPDPVYEDPQLQANTAYGVAGTAKVVNVEEDYLWNLLRFYNLYFIVYSVSNW